MKFKHIEEGKMLADTKETEISLDAVVGFPFDTVKIDGSLQEYVEFHDTYYPKGIKREIDSDEVRSAWRRAGCPEIWKVGKNESSEKLVGDGDIIIVLKGRSFYEDKEVGYLFIKKSLLAKLDEHKKISLKTTTSSNLIEYMDIDYEEKPLGTFWGNDFCYFSIAEKIEHPAGYRGVAFVISGVKEKSCLGMIMKFKKEVESLVKKAKKDKVFKAKII